MIIKLFTGLRRQINKHGENINTELENIFKKIVLNNPIDFFFLIRVK